MAITLDQERVMFRHELGLAVSQWSAIEHCLCNIVTQCVGESEHNTLAIGYFSIENFRSKLSFCNALMQEKFGTTPHIEKWNSLSGQLGQNSSKRNKLAHRADVLVLGNPEGRRVLLIEWVDELKTKTASSTGSRKSIAWNPPRGALGVRDLTIFHADFVALTCALMNFYCDLKGTEKQHPISSEQPDPPPSLHTIANRIHAIFEPRLKPSLK